MRVSIYNVKTGPAIYHPSPRESPLLSSPVSTTTNSQVINESLGNPLFLAFSPPLSLRSKDRDKRCAVGAGDCKA